MSGFSQHRAQQRLMLGQQCSAPSQAAQTQALGLRRSTRALPQRAPCRTQRRTSHNRSAADLDLDSSSESASGSGVSSSRTDDSDTHSWLSEEDEDAGSARPARRRQGRAAAAASRRNRTVRQMPGGPSQPPAAAAAASQHAEDAFHQPYSHLLVCEAQFDISDLRISSLLCTDLAELHSKGSCPVQVSVVVHPSGWGDSEDCKAYILQQQHPNAAHQQQPAVGQQYGPYEARLARIGKQFNISALSHDGKLKQFFKDRAHTLVLQERVPGSGGRPHFRLHIQPGSPAQPDNNYGQLISRAGEGKGLQVFPGSVEEVTAEAGSTGHVSVHRTIKNGTRKNGTRKGTRNVLTGSIPKALSCSQLPAAAGFPLSFSLKVLEQQADG